MQAAVKKHRIARSVDWYLHNEWILALSVIAVIVGIHWLRKHG